MHGGVFYANSRKDVNLRIFSFLCNIIIHINRIYSYQIDYE